MTCTTRNINSNIFRYQILLKSTKLRVSDDTEPQNIFKYMFEKKIIFSDCGGNIKLFQDK